MKNLTLILLLAFVGCSNKYSAVVRPLRNIDNNCRCRYVEPVKRLYDCEINNNILNGMPPKVAKLEAQRVVYGWVYRVQMSEARNPRLKCDCNDPTRYAEN